MSIPKWNIFKRIDRLEDKKEIQEMARKETEIRMETEKHYNKVKKGMEDMLKTPNEIKIDYLVKKNKSYVECIEELHIQVAELEEIIKKPKDTETQSLILQGELDTKQIKRLIEEIDILEDTIETIRMNNKENYARLGDIVQDRSTGDIYVSRLTTYECEWGALLKYNEIVICRKEHIYPIENFFRYIGIRKGQSYPGI